VHAIRMVYTSKSIRRQSRPIANMSSCQKNMANDCCYYCC
jgi:hypothetical protein